MVRIFDLDLKVALCFYDNQNEWLSGNVAPWVYFYKYGEMPAVLVAVSLILLFIFTFINKGFFQNKIQNINYFRKQIIFMPLAYIIGPGIIVNSLLKGFWGRPRPRDIINFGGQYNFEPVFTIDLSSPGNAFCCGHCSIAFIFLAFFFIFKNTNNKFAYIFFIVAIIFGVLMSIARIKSGAHFLSDALWSACVTYFTCIALYYFFLNKKFNSL